MPKDISIFPQGKMAISSLGISPAYSRNQGESTPFPGIQIHIGAQHAAGRETSGAGPAPGSTGMGSVVLLDEC